MKNYWKISIVISKNISFKIRTNLTLEQRTALKELSQSTENKVYSYDKGISFVILNNKDPIRKIKEQIGDSVVSKTDPTSALTSKTQKYLATRTYFQLYPSDPIPPGLYGVIKAHKKHSALWYFSIYGRINSSYSK